MANERSVFGEHVPFGFPNMSAICEWLIDGADTTAVDFWQEGFGNFAKAVLETIRMNAQCLPKQAKVIVNPETLDYAFSYCSRSLRAPYWPRWQ